MNTKTILGISLTAAFAVSLIFAQNAFAGIDNDWLVVTDSDVEANGNNVLYSAITLADIPHVDDDRLLGVLDSGYPVAGFAWLDVDTSSLSTINFAGATIHPEVVDSRQNPDNWHPHTGELIIVEDQANDLILCVNSLESPHAGIAINGDQIRMNMKANSATVLPDEDEGATGFFLQVNDDCPNPTDVDLPGNGLKPNIVSPPLPGLEVIAWPPAG